MSEIEVKALEWAHSHVPHRTYPQWRADTIVGQYVVVDTAKTVEWYLDGKTQVHDTSSVEAAQAAAQADYEARIRSALVERKAEPVAWRWRGPKGGWIYDDKRPAGWHSEPVFSTSPEAPVTAEGEPVLFVSEQQLASCIGTYLPTRKHREGNFQMPLYAAPVSIIPADTDAAQIQEVALARATAREDLFPAMSSRIKAEREQARRKAFEEAADIIKARMPLYTEDQALNACRECISSIRQRAEEACNADP